MISTDITGGAGGDASQVFNLLAVVANPEVYGEKLKALVTATDEHKKFVALVAPASEILELRKQIALDKQAAVKLVADARAEAAEITAAATLKVQAMTTETQALVATARGLAADAQAASTAKLAEIDAVLGDLKTRLAAATAAEKAAKKQTEAVVSEKKLLESEKEQVVAIKTTLIAKSKAFAEDIAK